MNYEQFTIWLHGFLEISNAETINKEQTQIIKDHLALLFEKKTPDRSKKSEKTDLQILQEKIKEIEEQNRGKSIPIPPYNPVPMPIYPNWDKWIQPDTILCKDTTASPPLDLVGTTFSTANSCQEIPIGEQFVGVDMKFDTDVHKTKIYC